MHTPDDQSKRLDKADLSLHALTGNLPRCREGAREIRPLGEDRRWGAHWGEDIKVLKKWEISKLPMVGD